jgi:Beta-lactamase enzyme family
MSYFSNAEDQSLGGWLGCGPSCSCGPCKSGMSGLDEWYEKEKADEAPKAQPANVASTSQSAPGPKPQTGSLKGWNGSGIGLGYYGLPSAVGPTAGLQTSSDAEQRLIQGALRRGIRNTRQLSNMIFFARHPSRKGIRLQANEVALIGEWRQIRERIVLPALRQMFGPGMVAVGPRRPGFVVRRGINRGHAWAHKGLGQAPTALSSKFLWPRKFIWGAKTSSTNIQSSFQRALDAVSKNPVFSHLPDVRTIPIAIMALDSSGSRPIAGQREMEMFFSGSLLKVAAMYAAFQLRVAANDLAATLDAAMVDTPAKLFQRISQTFDKQIDESVQRIRLAAGVSVAMRVPKYPTVFDAEKSHGVWRLKFKAGAGNFADHLGKMIVGSHNNSARFCIRALGYSWINGVLQAAGFLRFGFPGSEGIWLAGDYDEEKKWPVVVIKSVNDDMVKQATTCFDMARLFALLHDKSLVKNTVHFATGLSGNDEMLKLLERAVDDPGARSLLKRAPRSFIVMQSKIGVGELKGGSCTTAGRDRCVYSEAAILKHPPSARKFVVVWQNLTYLRAHPTWWGDGLKRIVAVIQKTMDDYKP